MSCPPVLCVGLEETSLGLSFSHACSDWEMGARLEGIVHRASGIHVRAREEVHGRLDFYDVRISGTGVA